MSQADDATVARAARSGDPRATSVLWDRFSPLVRRMLRRTLGPQAEVDALVQQVFLRVIDQLGNLPHGAELRPLMVTATVRVLTGALRRARLRRLFGLRSPWHSDELPLGPADATTHSALTAVYRILDDLDPETRLLFTLKHFEGLQTADLASAMDASLSSAKRRLARADARVRAAVNNEPAFKAYKSGSSGDEQ